MVTFRQRFLRIRRIEEHYPSVLNRQHEQVRILSSVLILTATVWVLLLRRILDLD